MEKNLRELPEKIGSFFMTERQVMLMSPEFNDCKQILETAISNPDSLKDIGLRSAYLDAALATHGVLLSQAGVPNEDIQSTLEKTRNSLSTRQEIMDYCGRMLPFAHPKETQLIENVELILE